MGVPPSMAARGRSGSLWQGGLLERLTIGTARPHATDATHESDESMVTLPMAMADARLALQQT